MRISFREVCLKCPVLNNGSFFPQSVALSAARSLISRPGVLNIDLCFRSSVLVCILTPVVQDSTLPIRFYLKKCDIMAFPHVLRL